MTLVTLGINLGKNSCSVVGLDEQGAVVLRRRMRRHLLSEEVRSDEGTRSGFTAVGRSAEG